MNQAQAAEQSFRTGRGNWNAFDLPIDSVLIAARAWSRALDGIGRPWLCWSVDDDWSMVQQRLVAGVGWTPVVGFDPRVGPPPTISEAILVDFNQQLRLPVLYPHFVLEFVFAFADKLAFWHSDLLLTEGDMAKFARTFADLSDGEMAAVASPSGWRRLVAGRKRRYWELLGCTTRAASRSQFDHGCGWWMHFHNHPNFPGGGSRRYHWEYGCGIHHWQRACGGRVRDIAEADITYGHFSRISNKSYIAEEKNNVFRNLNKDIHNNYNLVDCANYLNLCHLLPSRSS